MNKRQDKLKNCKRWVIKIGSALLTNNGCGLNHDLLNAWVKQIIQLRDENIEVVLVSSGAVAEGVARLGWAQRPEALHELQSVAAVGQMGLIQAYEACFKQYKTHTAQILLTHDDITNRERYLNARMNLIYLISIGVVPIINENDTISNKEIRFGDNDSLAGLVANLIEADLLVILTDQMGLMTADPRIDKQATLIEEAPASDEHLQNYAGAGSALGRGGMQTKLQAASIAAGSGTHTIIASGTHDKVLLEISQGVNIGTLLYADTEPLTARQQWLANQKHIAGQVSLDQGAVKALQQTGGSLLAVGVTAVHGNFKRGEIVSCLNEKQQEVARGLINYNASEINRIKGKRTDEFIELLGYLDQKELIHRDNLILL